MSDNKRIAKNTIYLYIRTLFTMLIALYTSRVILEKLGVDDFGIYNAVGGIVGFLSFINGALSTGSSRFITFELGTGNDDRLKRTFSTLLSAHIIIAFVIISLAELVGIWFINHKMVIPLERVTAALFTFHISIITSFFTITQVPYNASIIAHEKMGVYAYIGIFEVVSKLGICYLLGIGGYDRLIVYATLMLFVQIILFLCYYLYCNSHFKEVKYRFGLDRSILKPILSFSGWSLFADGSMALANQGILVLLNMFFAPAVVSARAISLQVNNAANQFVQNFRTAANPQIVKMYAVKDYDGSKRLLLQSTMFSYYLMLVLCMPIFFLADPLLHIWLGDNVPDYTAVFLKLVVVQSLFQIFDRSFYTALYAKGQLKENALISPTVTFIVFPIIYVLFKKGFPPVALSWAYLISYALLGIIIKPLLIIKIVDYKWKDIIKVFAPCLLVTTVSSIPALFIDQLIDGSTIHGFLLEAALLVILVLIASYTVGLDREMKHKINTMISSNINKNGRR